MKAHALIGFGTLHQMTGVRSWGNLLHDTPLREAQIILMQTRTHTE